MTFKTYIFLFIALLTCTTAVNMMYAGTTGKISGTVTDAATGEQLVGVNVVVQGTTLGMSTDDEGKYVILNVPPGDYTLVVSMIGYQPVQMRSVHVNIDLTTTVDVNLQPSAVELEALIIRAERPLVMKDNTGSLSTVSADQIRSLPVQTISEILRLDAGIVEYQGAIHIRGGRPGEVSYWVDGLSTTDVYNGSNGVRVENSSVQELQVISGTFNAEYGQAMSGIVNTVTKEGGETYSGQIKVYAGDYVSNDDRFSMYKTLTTDQDPNTGLTRIRNSETASPLKDFNPIYNGEFSLSGPFPLLGNDVRFFAMGRYFYDEGYFYGVNWYKPNGAPGDGSIVAMNPNKATTLQGKVIFQLSRTIKATYGAYWNTSDRERNYFTGDENFTTHDYKYNPYGLPQNHSHGLTQIVTLNHVLSPTTFYELRVGNYYSKTEQYKYEDPTQKVNYLVKRNADSTTFDPYTAEGHDSLNALIARGEGYSYVANPNGPEGYIDPQSIGQPTSYSYVNKGMYPTQFNRSTQYWVGKFDLTSQIERMHEVKIGAEARFHTLTLHSYNVVAKKDALGNVIIPFEPAIPDVGTLDRDDYERKPIEISAYAQDKLEFSNIILNLGLRFDYFNAKAYVPADAADPSIYGPFKDRHIYRDSNGNGTVDPSEKVSSNEYTPEERRAFMQQKVDGKKALSPRLGLSFPITDRGIIHFSYGHFLQIPQFQYLYADPDFKISSSSGNKLMGNADLDPQKTVMYEIGLQQQLSDVMSVDATLFYRDVRGWVGTSPLIYVERDNGKQTQVAYSMYENKDYENVRGVTLKIERRLVNNFSFRADYTFQSAEGTYSDPKDAYNDIEDGRAPVLALLPLNWDQNHTINLQAIYSVSDWTFSLIGRYWTGLPYTPSIVPEAIGASAVTGLTTNSARLPDQKAVDISINKTIPLGGNVNVQFFANVYNLFDQRDATSVYSETGSPDYSTNINPSEIQYNPLRVSTVEDFVNQPSWYTAPRQIQLGMAIDF